MSDDNRCEVCGLVISDGLLATSAWKAHAERVERQLHEAQGKLDDLEGVWALADWLVMSLTRILHPKEKG